MSSDYLFHDASVGKDNQNKDRGGKRTVLVVDDETQITMLVGVVLRDVGFDVVLAASGVEALDIVATHDSEFDLVLLDLNMPDMGGEETFWELQKQNVNLPILLSSGYGAEGTDQRIMSNKKVDFIEKPYNAKDLIKKINQLLGEE